MASRPSGGIDDYREPDMPESPPEVIKSRSQAIVMSPVTNISGSAATPVTPRPLSTESSAMSGTNGSHSPLSSLNGGRTPSPLSMANSASNQQLPPACGARQLSKLKRFLTTLQQFGADISPDIGERVRSLVLGLVNSHLSIEEFHSKLQEATNFPLRPFVIPFLKANLPLLQRELLHCAHSAKQSPQQYLTHNEHILFDASHSPIESQEIVGAELNENGKRKLSPVSTKENGSHHSPDPSMPAKRHQSISPASNPRVSPPGLINPRVSPNGMVMGGPIRLEDISLSRELRERERVERERYERVRLERDRERHLSGFSASRPESLDQSLDRIDDDWKHVEHMLNCVMGMVEKTKRALAVLQERSSRDREELSIWMRRHAEGVDQDVKKRTNEMMAHTLRSTEDRVTEVKRRAEEAVNEVKRQAVHELQKAVAAAESKANEMVSAERHKMDSSLVDTRKSIHQEVLGMLNRQEESTESCWNCGRKASETCSGCNVARYCGSYCQHKDWENHHSVCGQTTSGVTSKGAAPPISTPTSSVPGTTSSPTSTTTTIKARSRSPSPVETINLKQEVTR